MKKKNQPLHILGAGAMGLLWGATFAQQGWSISLIHRKLSKRLQKMPISLESLSTITQYKVSNTTASELQSTIHILLVAVKAHQLVAAMKPLLPKLNPDSIIILMQNGAGSDSALLKQYPQLKKNTIIQAVTTHGALRINPFKVRQTGKGYCWLGFNPVFSENTGKQPIPQQLQPLLKLNLISGWKEDIKTLIWQKLVINASINPLTAILNCKNGALLKKDIEPLMAAIVSECCHIANNAGVDIDPLLMLQQTKVVCSQTAENKSSMLQDVVKGNRTEIDYINRYLSDIAEKYHIESPWNNCLTAIIKTLCHDRI